MIDEIEGITIMVSDQQKALEFYTQKLGFEKKLDTDVAGYRWVVVGPKNSNTVISLVDSAQMKNESQEKIEHTKKKIGTSTGIWFYTKDIKYNISGTQIKGGRNYRTCKTSLGRNHEYNL